MTKKRKPYNQADWIVRYDYSNIEPDQAFIVKQPFWCFSMSGQHTHFIRVDDKILITGKDDDYVYFKVDDQSYKSRLVGLLLAAKKIEKEVNDASIK